jgi:ABC-type multidrug transport system fused ATPase/permease subunit
MKKADRSRNAAYVAKLVRKFIIENRIFRVLLLPILLYVYLSNKFHFLLQEAIADMQQYVAVGIFDDHQSSVLVFMHAMVPAAHYLASFVYKYLSAHILYSILGDSFRHCLREYISVDHGSFHGLGSGRIHSLIERRTNAIMKLVETILMSVLINLMFLVIVCRHFFSTSRAVLVLILVQAVLYAAVSWRGALLKNISRKRYNQSHNRASNTLYGILQNYNMVKAYNKEESELTRYRRHLEAVESSSREYSQMGDFVEFVQKIVLSAPSAFLAFSMLKGSLFAELRSGNRYAQYVLLYTDMRRAIMDLKKDLFAMNENITDILDSKIENANPDDEHAGVHKDTFDASIEFRNVGYSLGNRTIISNFSARVEKGEKVGVIGKNGCGKSSLINVLLRFIDFRGEILIDGHDIRELSKASVRELMSFAPQSQYMFDGTVLENLLYPCKVPDERHIIEKCREFNMHVIFSRLENGYQTEVGESGKFLSGGQRQKIGFMRAVAKDSNIVLLDEPTSSLDANAERELIDMIFECMVGKTVFLVVHNHDLLSRCDKIFGLADSRITVYHTFESFIKDRSKY